MELYQVLTLIFLIVAASFPIYKYSIKVKKKKPLQTKVVYDTNADGQMVFKVTVFAPISAAVINVSIDEEMSGLNYGCNYIINDGSTILNQGENQLIVTSIAANIHYSRPNIIIETSRGKTEIYYESMSSGSIKIKPERASASTQTLIGSVTIKDIEISKIDTSYTSEDIKINVTGSDNNK